MKLYSIDDFRIDNFRLDRYRLDNYSIDGASGGGTIIDHSTPVTVVNANYDTSGNGGRKLVRLSNGWLVCAVISNGDTIRLYKSVDNGTTWGALGYRSINAGVQVAITSYGTMLHIMYNWASGTITNVDTFDALNANGGTWNTFAGWVSKNIDSSQSSIGTGISIAVDSSGNLYAAWASKNATYPNSSNIRYSKSTDGGATWATPTQITTINNSNSNYHAPCIVLAGTTPIIFTQYIDYTTYTIKAYVFTSSWTEKNVYQAANYIQADPCAVVDGNGHIHVVWTGRDSTDADYLNIRYSKSTDGGATWSSPIKLTNGNLYRQTRPSITCDKSNRIYVVWAGDTPDTPGNNFALRQIVYDGTWGSITDVVEGAASNNDVSTCENYKDFTQPLTIWAVVGSSVKFRGVWREA